MPEENGSFPPFVPRQASARVTLKQAIFQEHAGKGMVTVEGGGFRKYEKPALSVLTNGRDGGGRLQARDRPKRVSRTSRVRKATIRDVPDGGENLTVQPRCRLLFAAAIPLAVDVVAAGSIADEAAEFPAASG